MPDFKMGAGGVCSTQDERIGGRTSMVSTGSSSAEVRKKSPLPPMSEGDGYLKAIQQLPDDVCRHSGEGREVDSHLKCNT